MIFTPSLIVALAWLVLLGWGFNALLGRHLRLDDKLADVEARLAAEQHARLLAERSLSSTHDSLCVLARRHDSLRETERQRIGRAVGMELGRHLLSLKADLSLLHVSTSGVHPLITRKVGAMMGKLESTIDAMDAITTEPHTLRLDAHLRK